LLHDFPEHRFIEKINGHDEVNDAEWNNNVVREGEMLAKFFFRQAAKRMAVSNNYIVHKLDERKDRQITIRAMDYSIQVKLMYTDTQLQQMMVRIGNSDRAYAPRTDHSDPVMVPARGCAIESAKPTGMLNVHLRNVTRIQQ